MSCMFRYILLYSCRFLWDRSSEYIAGNIAPRARRKHETTPATTQKDIKRTNAALIKTADVHVTRNYAKGATAEIFPLSKKYFAEVRRKSNLRGGI